MRSYTTSEAARITGSTVRALRKRIERGQLRAVQHGRFWRIPHSELERVGLLRPPAPEGTEGTSEGAPGGAALERLEAENRRLAEELHSVSARLATAMRDLERLDAARQATEARAEAQAAASADLRERLRRLAGAGFFEQRRMLLELRRERDSPGARGYEVPEDLRARLELLPWWSSEGRDRREPSTEAELPPPRGEGGPTAPPRRPST